MVKFVWTRLSNLWLLFNRIPSPVRYWTMGSMGLFVGLTLYVAHISHATSYLSDKPEACINCHIMVPEYASWKRSSHAEAASCNDCHVPHDSTLRKYMFKAKDGMRHSAIFTLRREPQVIEAIPESKEVIQENCLRCHQQTVSEATTPIHADIDRSCVDCHREVPHGRVHSLSSTPNAAVPPLQKITPEWMDKAIDKDRQGEQK